MIGKLIILIFAFQLAVFPVFSQKLCISNLAPNTLTDSSFEQTIVGKSAFIRDETQKLEINSIWSQFNSCKSSVTKLETLFEHAFGGNFNTWFYFKIENTTKLSQKMILHADFIKDSLWVFDGNKLISKYFIKADGKSDLPFSSYRKFVLDIPTNAQYTYLLKQANHSYINQRSCPRLSNLSVFESRYFLKNNTTIFTYFFLFSYMIAVLGFVIIHYINFKEKVTLFYLGYLISIQFVFWRNFEDIQPYSTFSLPILPWFATKVFHSASIFIFYMLFLLTFIDPTIKWVKFSKNLIFCIFIFFIILEIPLQIYQPRLSFLFYFIFRQIIILIGIVTLVFLLKSTSYFSKYIFIGSLVLMVSELVSSYLPGPWSSLVSSFGVWLEVNIFTIVLGLRSYFYYKESINTKLYVLQLESENERKASQIKTQIAQDIHDDLGLHLTSLKFLGFEIKTKLTQKPLKPIIEKLNSGLDSLSIGLSEIIWSMNPEKDSIIEFSFYLKKCAENILDNQMKLVFEKNIEDEAIQINGVQRRNLLLCLKEAIHNIVKHSQANIVQIFFIQQKNLVSLSIIDDGKGFSFDKKNDNILHGNGLKNMEKRMKSIGGKFTLTTEKGSSVILELPVSN